MPEAKKSKGCFKGCLQIFIILAIIGYFVGHFESASCNVCGKYCFHQFENGLVFSDNDIADILGADRIEEFKNMLKSTPSFVYVLNIDSPENLENGGKRANVAIGITTEFFENIIYKGTLITTTEEDGIDGMIRIEKKYNNRFSKYEKVTYANDQNILYYNLDSQGIRIRNANSVLFGLSTLKGELFLKD